MKRIFPILLLLCLLAQLVPPARADGLAAGEGCLALIQRYEGFSASAYESGGRWYIGYGTQITKGAYPNGVSETEATALLRDALRSTETALNAFAAQNGVTLTQGQFDALADFTYTLGTSWLSGTSLLARLVSGEEQLSRRETARAFGVWSHSGGKVLPGLAARRLEEAALWLDGDTLRASEFCYLAVTREDGVAYATDFAVYERGGVYDALPTMFRLGYTPVGVRTPDGTLLRLGDAVTGDRSGSVVWERNAYAAAYPDVRESDWYYDYVMELSAGGVINGREDGTYAPDLPAAAGEALKLILLAAGHPEQAPLDARWASGYAAYAAERGFLPSDVLADLDAPLTRRNVARLAARALGFGQSFAATPFVDADDGYVTALAEIGVLEGTTEDGLPVYYPDRSLTRSEISAIVWRLRRAAALDTRQTVTYGSRTLEVARGVALNAYDKNGFSGSGKEISFTEAGITVLRGVDASRFQGNVDWHAAAADGISFAILRVGGRYQQSGEFYDDRKFEEYYAGARAAGLKVGAYFYSQAVSVAEAVEEADYVLERLRGKTIDAPVVFDWETAAGTGARTENVPVGVVCDCAIAFCERVRAAGYAPMIYMNTHDGYLRYDLTRLTDYAVWYAGQYDGAYPTFVYDFAMWQYTDKGSVAGFPGKVDMDLWFLR